MKRQGLVGLYNTGFAPERQITALLGPCAPKYCFRRTTFTRILEAAMLCIVEYASLKIGEVFRKFFHHD
jgi:hypothetical protein